MSATPINLNKARKIKAQRDAEAKAAENRAKFGRTKAQKEAEAAEAVKAARALDDRKREP